MHCHILAHEDLGAMGWMDVIGGTPPPTFPVNGDINRPYSAYYQINVLGDANDDGVLDFGDIEPFVLALFDPKAYMAMYPGVDLLLRLDINGDGSLDFGDIEPFVDLLFGN